MPPELDCWYLALRWKTVPSGGVEGGSAASSKSRSFWLMEALPSHVTRRVGELSVAEADGISDAARKRLATTGRNMGILETTSGLAPIQAMGLPRCPCKAAGARRPAEGRFAACN